MPGTTPEDPFAPSSECMWMLTGRSKVAPSLACPHCLHGAHKLWGHHWKNALRENAKQRPMFIIKVLREWNMEACNSFDFFCFLAIGGFLYQNQHLELGPEFISQVGPKLVLHVPEITWQCHCRPIVVYKRASRTVPQAPVKIFLGMQLILMQ